MIDVTIRGIDEKVYREFSAEARRQNKSVGELITEAMTYYLQRLHKKSYEISHYNEVVVSKEDLIELNAPVRFCHIERLIIDDDMDVDTFEKYIVEIAHCEYVEFPAHIPKLYAYSKCRHCGKVVRREKSQSGSATQ